MSGGGAAVFDYAVWSLRFPELAGSVNEALASQYWAEAGLYLDPSASSAICDVGKRTLILNLITAHIAKLNAPIGGQESSDLVGRIASASEGSVSVATAALTVPGSAEWFAQTRYGFSAWQAMAPARTARYVPGPGAAYRFTVGMPFFGRFGRRI